jgi:hypothetical protein
MAKCGETVKGKLKTKTQQISRCGEAGKKITEDIICLK